MLTRNLPRDWRGWHWTVELVVAALILLFLLAQLAGGNDRVPDVRGRGAEPGSAGSASPEEPPVVTETMVFGLWHVLQLHELGRVEEAIDAWIALELPRSVELYRYLGLAQAYLATGQFDEARGVLAAASGLQVDHPLLHYYRAVYLLGRSETATEWPDWVGPARVIPATGELEVVPNTASMLRREARRELREALADAISVCEETSLFPPHAQTGMWVEPTVHDFLRSVSALRYEAACHQLLGKLYLEQGAWETVERHLDAARAAGLAHVEGYLALGQDLEQAGYYSEAARVYLKAMAAGEGFSRPARRALRSLGEAWGP